MTSKVLLQGLLRKGKDILQGVLKTKTQNVAVKVAKAPKPQSAAEQVVRYQSKLTQNKLVNIWQKIFPKIYFNSFASQLGRQAAWRYARNVPLLSFVGLVMAQHADKEEDEIIQRIHTFVKTAGIQTSPLLQKIQQLSLDNFEFGQLIGQGCNAAVYEARLKSDDSESQLSNKMELAVMYVTEKQSSVDIGINTPETTSDTERTLQEIHFSARPDDTISTCDSDAESDITVLSSDYSMDSCDGIPLEFCASRNTDIFFDTNSYFDFGEVSDAESDFEIITCSDDEMDDDDKAPKMFEVHVTTQPEAKVVSLTNAGCLSVLSISDCDTDSERPLEGDSQENWHRSPHSDFSPTPEENRQLFGPKLSLSLGSLSGRTTNIQDDLSGVTLKETAQYSSLDSNLSTGTSDKFNLAVKMMFNYDVESNASTILREMEMETVPARLAEARQQMRTWQNGHKVRKKHLPPHPNIVEMWDVFVDPVPHLPDSLHNYPAALPARLNPDGMGRNMTMFLVMKKYDCTVAEYLSTFNPGLRERLVLLLQLFEALDHMRKHEIAHRDLKLDNMFLELCADGAPQLVLGDFGCCLADEMHGLQIPYTSEQIIKGGNAALMAPEISTAEPGKHSFLDYRKSDLWAAGTLAYQILGADNPFYSSQNKERLDSRSFTEQQLPPLPENVPTPVRHLISAILSRDPNRRPSSRQAADLLHVLLWAPSDWLLPSNKVTRSQITWWLVSMATEVLLGSKSSERLLKRGFLQTINLNDLNSVMLFVGVKVDM